MKSLSILIGGLCGYAAHRKQSIPLSLQATLISGTLFIDYMTLVANSPDSRKMVAMGLLIAPATIAFKYGMGYGIGKMAAIAKGDS